MSCTVPDVLLLDVGIIGLAIGVFALLTKDNKYLELRIDALEKRLSSGPASRQDRSSADPE